MSRAWGPNRFGRRFLLRTDTSNRIAPNENDWITLSPLDPRRFHEGHKNALQQFVNETAKVDIPTGSQLYADPALPANSSFTVDGEFARELTAFAPSVGIILARTADGASYYGTGFRVGDNHFLTNWHVARGVQGTCCIVRRTVSSISKIHEGRTSKWMFRLWNCSLLHPLWNQRSFEWNKTLGFF